MDFTLKKNDLYSKKRLIPRQKTGYQSDVLLIFLELVCDVRPPKPDS